MVLPIAGWLLGGVVVSTVAYLCSDDSSDSSDSGSSHSKCDAEKERRQAARQQAQQANEAEFSAWQRRHGLHGLSANQLLNNSDPILTEALGQLDQSSHRQQQQQELAELDGRLKLVHSLQQALNTEHHN